MKDLHNLVKPLLLMCLLSVFFSGGAKASTYTAATCNFSDVNAVINGPTHTAVNGDTIQIPSGTCTWSSQLNVSVGITLIGNGTPNTLPSQFGAGTVNTTIIDNAPSSGAMINASVPSGQNLRISTLAIKPISSTTPLFSPIVVNGICTITGCSNFRADNLSFSGWNESGTGNTYQAEWMMRLDNIYGVADHNSDTDTGNLLANDNNSSWLGIGSYGDNSWASPDTFGTGSQFFFENNSLNNLTEDCDISGGCRITIRFTQVTSNKAPIAYTHGTESGQRMRGGRQFEIYGNTMTCTSACDVGAIDLRSGTARVFGNVLNGPGGAGWNSIVKLDDYRTQKSFAVWNACDGVGQWDKNDGTVYASGTFTGVSVSGSTITTSDSSKNWSANQWLQDGYPYSLRDTTAGWGVEITGSGTNTISYSNALASSYGSNIVANAGDSYQVLRSQYCVDQPARSGGTLLSAPTPSLTGWVNQILDPVYEWSDQINGTIFGAGNIVGTDTNKLVANRDYYNEAKNQAAQTSPASPFNGTSGTGHGTLANRPTTCTQGVAYWATDQGNWNQSGGAQGVLYICGASGWPPTPSYTPYTYPHPLVAGGSAGTGGTTTPNPPTGLSAVVQ